MKNLVSSLVSECVLLFLPDIIMMRKTWLDGWLVEHDGVTPGLSGARLIIITHDDDDGKVT